MITASESKEQSPTKVWILIGFKVFIIVIWDWNFVFYILRASKVSIQFICCVQTDMFHYFQPSYPTVHPASSMKVGWVQSIISWVFRSAQLCNIMAVSRIIHDQLTHLSECLHGYSWHGDCSPLECLIQSV